MTQKIIFKTLDGDVAVIIPTEDTLSLYSIEEIAEKDVPEGLPFKIIDSDLIPTDRTFRNAWEVDTAELTDGIGGKHDMFITDPQHPDYVAPLEAEE